MTSASELFFHRRSRFGRSVPELGSQPSLDRSFHHQNHQRHHNQNHHNRHGLDGCDPLRRSSHGRRSSNRDSHSGRSEQSTNHIESSNTANTQPLSSRSRPRSAGTDRLPGAVLLARSRLLERLRGGVSVPESRESSGRPSVSERLVTIISERMRHMDEVDSENETPSNSSSILTDLSSQLENRWFMRQKYKKPPGLDQEALDSLQVETFSCGETESSVCSICLESYLDGDVILHLPCAHRFHSTCLDPWVRTCGDCPYCRRGILFSSENATTDRT